MKRDCCPISFCGIGPCDTICKMSPAPQPKTVTKFYHPCPRQCCDCPDSWPLLVPKVKCCVKAIAIQGPPATPVIPLCQSLRKCPEDCPKPRRRLSPARIAPPIIPFCKPCCFSSVKVQPRPGRIRCVDPVLPCCPPPCCPPPKKIHPPEPPYPKYCPVFPPCICPDRPLISHNGVRQFRITADCKTSRNRDDPMVCYVLRDPAEMGQYNYFMGCCYTTP